MASRGERNNNPGNIEYGKYAISQGAVGSDGRFAIFSSITDGIAAQVNLLRKSYIAKGFDTPAEIINRYGNDPGSADDLSVRNYIRYVAGKLGIGINDKVSADQTGILAQAMREFETGKTTVMGAMLPSGNPFAEGTVEEAINKATGLDAIPQLFNGQLAGRIVAVVIGVILIGLAIAAFTLTTDVKAAAIKAVT